VRSQAYRTTGRPDRSDAASLRRTPGIHTISSSARTTGQPARLGPGICASPKKRFTRRAASRVRGRIRSAGRHARTDRCRSAGRSATQESSRCWRPFSPGDSLEARSSWPGTLGTGQKRHSPNRTTPSSDTGAASRRGDERRRTKKSRCRKTSTPPDNCIRAPGAPEVVNCARRRVPRRSRVTEARAAIAGQRTLSVDESYVASSSLATRRMPPSTLSETIARTSASTSTRHAAARSARASISAANRGRTRPIAGNRSSRTRFLRYRRDAFDGSSTNGMPRALPYARINSRASPRNGRAT